MGSVVWTLITYFATFGIAFVAFRLVLADKQEAQSAVTLPLGADAKRPEPKSPFIRSARRG